MSYADALKRSARKNETNEEGAEGGARPWWAASASARWSYRGALTGLKKAKKKEEDDAAGGTEGGGANTSMRKRLARMLSSDGKTKGDRKREEEAAAAKMQDERKEQEAAVAVTAADQVESPVIPRGSVEGVVDAAEKQDTVVLQQTAKGAAPPLPDWKQVLTDRQKAEAEKEAREFATAAEEQARAMAQKAVASAVQKGDAGGASGNASGSQSLRERAKEARAQAKALGDKASQVLSKQVVHKREASGTLLEDAPLTKLAKGNEAESVHASSAPSTRSIAAAASPEEEHLAVDTPGEVQAETPMTKEGDDTSSAGKFPGRALLLLLFAGVSAAGVAVYAKKKNSSSSNVGGEKKKPCSGFLCP